MRARFLTGLIIVVPLVITFWVLRFLFLSVAGVLQPLIRLIVGEVLPGLDLVLSVVLFFLILYGVGVLAAFVIGRRLIHFGESILVRIPLVKSIYTASKQVVETLSLPNKATFKRVVFIDFPHPGMKVPAFVTGSLVDQSGNKFYKVFVPTTPNPTSGYLELVPAGDVVETDISVEDGIKMVVSGGILGPDRVELRR